MSDHPSRRFVRAAAFLFALAAAPAVHAEPVPVVDRGPDGSNTGPVKLTSVDNVRYRKVGDHYLSGGSQFSEQGLAELVNILKGGGGLYDPSKHFLVIVDLRQEAHGIINGHAVRWMDDSDPERIQYDWVNLGKPRKTVLEDELAWLAAAAQQKQFFDHPKGTKLGHFEFKASPPYKWQTEQQLVESTLGAGHYIRLTVPDHKKPEHDSDVDIFLAELGRVFEAARQENKTPWLHFHCAAGQGRTTTFMALYELVVRTIVLREQLPFVSPPIGNDFHPRVEGFFRSLTQDATRLTETGKGGADIRWTTGYDIANGIDHTPDPAKGLAAMDRFHFIMNFYWYLRLNDFPSGTAWSTWARSKSCALDDYAENREGQYPYCQVDGK